MIYCLLSKLSKHLCETALGHEIHITRLILFDLLIKKIIDENVTIVTFSLDRSFMYENMFKNIIDSNFFNTLNINKNDIVIDLTIYSPVANVTQRKIKYLENNNYKLINSYHQSELIECLKNINYNNLYKNEKYNNIIEKEFTIIHHRFDADMELLSKIVKILLNNNIDRQIIIFGSSENIEKIKLLKSNIIIENNLKNYASLLNNNNCKLFISEWSGGGQLSQYCTNSNIVYYFKNHNGINYEKDKFYEKLEKSSKIGLCSGWDFRCVTSCKRTYIHDYNIFLEYIKSMQL